MPPKADKHLEERILKAASRLWRLHGNSGVTLRGIAREAGTTTPTIYQRFRNKEAILAALALRVRDALNAELFSCSTLEEAARRYLRFAESNPHDYELLGTWWPTLAMAPDVPRPGRVWLLSNLAARFGGRPEEYAQAFYLFLLLCHGAAAMLATEAHPAVRQEIRENCIKVCDKLIANVAIFRSPSDAPEWTGS